MISRAAACTTDYNMSDDAVSDIVDDNVSVVNAACDERVDEGVQCFISQ